MGWAAIGIPSAMLNYIQFVVRMQHAASLYYKQLQLLQTRKLLQALERKPKVLAKAAGKAQDLQC